MEHDHHLHPPVTEASADQVELLENEAAKEFKYEQIKTPELRAKYVDNTENLIARVIDEGITDMVFLDKSARPVAWFVRELWPTLARRSDGSLVPMPTIKLVNIDREQWGDVTGRSEDRDGAINIDRVDANDIDRLRRTFTANTHDLPTKIVDENGRATDAYPSAPVEHTMFDGKKVMIVDEVSVSGDTLTIADRMFKRAFPEAAMHTAHWMTPEIVRDKKSGVSFNSDLPVWYRRNRVAGRLVGNRSEAASAASHSRRQRTGALFLGTRFPQVDQIGLELKQEIKEIAREVEEGEIPVSPSRYRDEAGWDYIMEQVNHMSMEDFVALRRQAEKEGESFASLYATYKHDRATSS